MDLTLLISHALTAVDSSTILTALAIMLGVSVLEDPTTVVVGVLVADGRIDMLLALGALYAGILLGDLALYGLGYLAGSHPRLSRFIEHEAAVPLRGWLEARYVLTLFTVRFIPGLRLPTYTASGFFRGSLGTFSLVIVLATFVWTALLFYAFIWFGSFSSEWFGWTRYGIAALFVILLFLAGRYNLKRARGSNPNSAS